MHKRGIFIISLIFSLVLVSSVFAGDVAYIYNSKARIDSNVVGVFNKLGLGVSYIQINNLPSDLSKFDFVYVGDEYFNKDIPVTNYNTIISNPYLGEKSGITDRSGISSMTSTENPRVTFNGSNLKVYIVSKDNRGIYVPYYFLSDKHKAVSSRSYAGTYSTSSGNFGDVISFFDKGSVLENGKISKGNICFFGITKSSYWTEDAKKLFSDCINFVKPVVNSVNNTNITIICSKDEDCGLNGYLGFDFCSGKNIFNTYVEFKCTNPGTDKSSCSSQKTDELVDNCSSFCFDGECQNFKCSSDEQCDDSDATTKDICTNPSTKESSCVNLPYFIQCRVDLDCNDNNKSTEDICTNPSTKESSCVHNIYHIRCNQDLDCDDNNSLTVDSCSNSGMFISSCVHNIYHIRCNQDLDCDDNNSLTVDSCLNPGTPDSACSFITNLNLSYIEISSLTAIPGVTNVRLDFNVKTFGSSGIKGYYFSLDKDNWTFVSGNETSYIIENLLPASSYNIFMRAIDNLDVSSSEINLSINTLAQEPDNSIIDSPSGGGGSSGGGSGSSSASGSSSSTISNSLYGYASGGICVTKWECTDWSSCQDNNQVRSCYYPPNFCMPKDPKPSESRDCVLSNLNPVNEEQTNNESENQSTSGRSLITGGVIGALNSPFIWVFLFLLIIAGAYLYLRSRAGAMLIKKIWK